ncbi:MAG: DUF1287 domain-containing protein [bacterium]|nr:DUF1287 domain-containing protein [bacterium]
MISTLLVSWVLIHFTLQPVPGWEFAAEQATKQAPSLEKKTLALKLNAGQPAFVKTSAAPWFAHKAAVWDPENETTRQSISSHFNQPEATFADSLVSAAEERTQHSVVYDGAYQSLDYPGGDVADNRGVCTDVIIRSYRALGIDLQKLVHEDMVAHFSAYPNLWNMIRPDSNIDHRRVPNLQMFFQREGAELEVTNRAADYLPGDLVTWMLPGNLPHIGIVGRRISEDGQRHLVIHNVGRGPRQEDFLFEYDITGHYRWVN